MNENILELEGVKKYYPVRQRGLFSKPTYVRAVDGVTLSIEKNTSFGLVGESGCGKSTLSRSILRLEDTTAGSIRICGQEISSMHGKELKALRREVQMVFQNPFYSLNPRMTVEALIAEPLIIHEVGDKAYRQARVRELLDRVGLNSGAAVRYPHEFSGGQRQRIGIARALAMNPKIVICDEPVSALDVSIQAQILNLLKELKHDLQLTYVFISHNLSVVKYMSQRIAVMYLGTIVEIAPAEELYANPMHPYTQMLLSAIPDLQEKRGIRDFHAGDVGDASGETNGCPFASRCPHAEARCYVERPILEECGVGHMVACHRCNGWRNTNA